MRDDAIKILLHSKEQQLPPCRHYIVHIYRVWCIWRVLTRTPRRSYTPQTKFTTISFDVLTLYIWRTRVYKHIDRCCQQNQNNAFKLQCTIFWIVFDNRQLLTVPNLLHNAEYYLTWPYMRSRIVVLFIGTPFD